MRRPTALLTLTALAASLVTLAGAAPRPGFTELVSGGLEGGLPDAFIRPPEVSADGRYVVIESDASNLVADDTNEERDIFVYDRHTGVTERVSVASDGTEASSRSFDPSISADGRYVAFWSWAHNLVDLPLTSTNGFRHDRLTGTTDLVTASTSGEPANGASTMIGHADGISADGRYVTFVSLATNLLDGVDMPGGVNHGYVKDMDTGEVELVSVDHTGQPAPENSQNLSISAGGRYVVFSTRSQLTPVPTFGRRGIYLRDREAGTTELVSVNSAGEMIADSAWAPRLSADGRIVAFRSSSAWNAAPRGRLGPFPAVYIHDRDTGRTERVSVTSAGQQANNFSNWPWLSADGRYVTFWSTASNLHPGAGGNPEVYVRDRLLGTTELVSLSTESQPGGGTSQTPAISGDGGVVAFMSRNAALIPGVENDYDLAFTRLRGPDVGVVGPVGVGVADGRVAVSGLARFAGTVLAEGTTSAVSAADPATGRLAEAALVYRGEDAQELLVRLHVEDLPTRVYAANFAVLVDQPGPVGTVFGAALTVDGVDYEVRLSAGADSWEPVVQVLRCEPVCVPVAEGTGSYGTAGEEVQLAFSLDDVGAAEGSVVTGLRAYSAAGSAAGGPVEDLAAIPLADTAIPGRSVAVGFAPVQPDAPPVAFDLPAALTGDGFLAQRGVGGLPPGQYRAHVRVCLGDDCRTTTSQPIALPQ